MAGPARTLRAEALACRPVDGAVRTDDAAVVAPGALRGDAARVEVPLHRLEGALQGVPESGAARDAKLRVLRGRLEDRERAHPDVFHRPVEPADDSARTSPRAAAEEARNLPQHPHGVEPDLARFPVVLELAGRNHLAEPAPLPPRPAAVGRERLL